MESHEVGKENMNIMQVPKSPSFLKPKPIRLRKKNPKPTALPLEEVDVNKKHLGYLSKSPKVISNPFRRDVNKRKRETEEHLSDDSNSFLWKQVNRITNSSESNNGFSSPVVPSVLDESALSAFSDDVSPNFQPFKEKCADKPKAKVLPVDWSLKTKVRFTSPNPFPSRGTFRTFEEVNGTIGFVRCLHSGEPENKLSDLHSSHGSKFFQQCLVWMHPNLPWLNLFPRNDFNSTRANSSSLALDSAAKESLHSNWCDSFRSLYQLVRLYQCPYFYMCTPTFTVLFRCAGAASIPVLHALITPTTKGFRKALKEEGIAFTMPLCQSKDVESEFEDSINDKTPPLNVDEDCNEKLDDDDDDQLEDSELKMMSWLESLGVSQDSLPALNKIKQQDDIFYKVDHKPESLVYIEDSETQALVNFLLNSNFCISSIGPMAGVPPTLLSPTAFLGGTLQSLKLRHGKVKTGDSEMESVEIKGPILPNTVHTLCTLFSSTQENGFSLVMSSHNPTSAFSMVNPQSPIMPCIFAKNNLTDCGLPGAFINQMCSKSKKFAFNSIKLEDGLFSWM